MPSLPKNAVILGIDPTSRGLSFAVLEAPSYLVNWGSREATTKSVLKKLDELLTHFKPDMLVLEDLTEEGARRRARAKREIQAMELLAFTRGVRVERVSRLAVRDTFAPGKTSTRWRLGSRRSSRTLRDICPGSARRGCPRISA